MRKTKFDPKMIEEAEFFANIGLPQRDMAKFWGVSEDSITRWKKRYPEFAEALKRGEANRNITLLRAMMKNAIERGNTTMQIFLAKNWLGMRDDIESRGGLGLSGEQIIYEISDNFLPSKKDGMKDEN